MNVSGSAHGASASSDPSNLQLALYLRTRSQKDVLRHFIGHPLRGAPPSLNEALVIGLDVEWWEREPKPIIDIGLVELLVDPKLRPRLSHRPHAEEVIEKILGAHIRIMETAHLFNTSARAGISEIYHFGTSLFAPADTITETLKRVFKRAAGGDGTKRLRPVILVGHAAGEGLEKLKTEYGVDVLEFGTIVKVVDTQHFARESNIRAPQQRGANISMHDLLEYFSIPQGNVYSAGNRIVYTMLAAILTCLKVELYPLGPQAAVNDRDIQTIINKLMKDLQNVEPPLSYGVTIYCTKCDSRSHFRQERSEAVSCGHCAQSRNAKLRSNSRTHKTDRCIHTMAGHSRN
jgi:hypothetical protein